MPRRPPTIWLDTCVMVDVTSDYQFSKNARGGRLALVETALNALRGYWMAIALDERQEVTISFQHEIENTVLRYAPPGSLHGSFVGTYTWITKDFCFPRWDAQITDRGRTKIENGIEVQTSNDDRDQILVDHSRDAGLTVVTRDGGCARRARRAGLEPLTPMQYATSVISFETARGRFMEGVFAGISAWLRRNGWGQQQRDAMEVVWDTYAAIWQLSPS